MKILSVFPLPGIAYTHDASACIVTDEGVGFATEEERLLRSQHAIGHWPERAAMVALKATGLGPLDIDKLVTTSIERCRRGSDYRARLRFVRQQLQIPDSTPDLCVPHHLAHSALAVLTSPFDSCAFLTLDGGGDGTMGHWGRYEHGRFRIFESCEFSPAAFYTYVTGLCGFSAFDEGKVMGLAAYGQVDDKLHDYFDRHFRIKVGGLELETDLRVQWQAVLSLRHVDPDAFARAKYLRWRLHMVGSDNASWIDEIPPQNIAATGQRFVSALLRQVVSNVTDRTGATDVACAGGLFHNVAAIGDLARSGNRQSFHFPVAPHDAGLSLGAGLWTRHIHGRPRIALPLTPYLASAFEPKYVEALLRDHGLEFERPANYAQEVARLIGSGVVVGWFHGRAEFGARALGARSVLADPRERNMRARLNQLLKKRDWFMPYAPSILEEWGDEYFDDFRPVPYMNVAFRARDGIARRIPAAIHVDGTCRAHVVGRNDKSTYRAVIESFWNLTGIPLVLNTSFNRHGLPMVSTPRQAIQLLLESCVDVLAIEGYLVKAPMSLPSDRLLSDQDSLALMSLQRAADLAREGRLGAAERLARSVDSRLTVTNDCLRDIAGTEWKIDSDRDALLSWWKGVQR